MEGLSWHAPIWQTSPVLSGFPVLFFLRRRKTQQEQQKNTVCYFFQDTWTVQQHRTRIQREAQPPRSSAFWMFFMQCLLLRSSPCSHTRLHRPPCRFPGSNSQGNGTPHYLLAFLLQGRGFLWGFPSAWILPWDLRVGRGWTQPSSRD